MSSVRFPGNFVCFDNKCFNKDYIKNFYFNDNESRFYFTLINTEDPLTDLIPLKHYGSSSLQTSKGKDKAYYFKIKDYELMRDKILSS